MSKAALLLLASCLLAAPAWAADPTPEPLPDVAQLAAQTEAAWQAVLAMPDDNPLSTLMAWGTLMMQEAVLAHARSQVAAAHGEPTAPVGDVTPQVLARWRRLRPDAAGPDLFPVLRLEDPAAKLAAVVAIAERYPDDTLAAFEAAMLLRGAGEGARATELLEAFADRKPTSPVAQRLLANHFSALGDRTRQGAAMRRWAALAPGNPDLVQQWLGSSLVQQDPVATERVLADFLASPPHDVAGVGTCAQIARNGGPAAEAARDCLVDIAGESSLAAPVLEAATSALAELAAASHDWAGLAAALDRLPAEARARATLTAAYRLQPPADCSAMLDLLRPALASPQPEGQLAALAAPLQYCGQRPEAKALLLDVLARAPLAEAPEVALRWAQMVNGRWQGALPAAEAVPILERRRAEAPPSATLFRALDAAYSLAELTARRLTLLREWQQAQPDHFDTNAALALAVGLFQRGDTAGAMTVLEAQLGRHPDPKVAAALSNLYLATKTAARGAQFATSLLASDQPWVVAYGHLLTARAAAGRRDFVDAERSYWAYLEAQGADAAVGAELLAVVAASGGGSRLPELARRACEETALRANQSNPSRCAADLLARAGASQIATQVLSERAAALPDDPAALRELAASASNGQQWDVAERALRDVIALDPANGDDWVALAVFLEKHGSAEALAALLADSRRALPSPPTDLLRAVARGMLATEPRRSVDLLREARASLPAGASDAWINAELRDAYAALGREAP